MLTMEERFGGSPPLQFLPPWNTYRRPSTSEPAIAQILFQWQQTFVPSLPADFGGSPFLADEIEDLSLFLFQI